MKKQRMCTEECGAGYYTNKKYCCYYSCPQEENCEKNVKKVGRVVDAVD